jgi:hypothetical protein
MKSKAKNFRRETAVAGSNLYTKVSARKPSAPGCKRAPKKNPTSDQMFRVNEHNAIRRLSMELDANFRPGDHHLILTYAGLPPSEAEARKHVGNFLRRVTRLCKKEGLVPRWVLATEYDHTRIHHHVIMSAGLPLDSVCRLWPHGIVRNTFLYGKTFRWLAEYIIKETRRTFRDPDSTAKRRYSSSRNLVKPVTKVEYLSKMDFDADPKAPKGYSVEADTVYRGENPFTGARYMEYTALPLDDGPMPKRRRRGKTVRPRSSVSLSTYRKAAPRQERMDC